MKKQVKAQIYAPASNMWLDIPQMTVSEYIRSFEGQDATIHTDESGVTHITVAINDLAVTIKVRPAV